MQVPFQPEHIGRFDRQHLCGADSCQPAVPEAYVATLDDPASVEGDVDLLLHPFGEKLAERSDIVRRGVDDPAECEPRLVDFARALRCLSG